MEFLEMETGQLPMALLLEADPAERRIAAYLPGAWGFAAREGNLVVGACVAGQVGEQTAEIFNIAVAPARQQQGIGSGLLRFVLASLAEKGVRRVELGTGSFGHQLTYYQRHGFRVETVVKDHFLIHYPEPLMEHGIRHKDMLRLSLKLTPTHADSGGLSPQTDVAPS
ncbi:GNAT family N-acetyltransferase [Aeromonas taiwanensis]